MGWTPNEVSSEARADGVGTRFKLRESRYGGRVVAIVDGVAKFSDQSYYTAHQWLVTNHPMSDSSSLALGRDYHDSVDREEYVG